MDGLDVGKLAADLASVERTLRVALLKVEAIERDLPQLAGFRVIVHGVRQKPQP